MEILSENQYGEYRQFVENHPQGGFTQVPAWAKVKNAWGCEIVVVRDRHQSIAAGMLILIKRLPMGYSMLYAPHGPVCDLTDKELLAGLLDGVKAVAKKHKGCSFKCDPYLSQDNQDQIDILRSLGFSFHPNAAENETIQRRFNYVLDIGGKTEEEVMAGFHQKTRYNIRLAQKKGVTCKVCGEEMIDEWMRLYTITGKRDNFIIRPKEYYLGMLRAFGGNIRLYICYYNGIAVSAAMTTNVAGKVSYVFGASDNEYRNVMPNYLMQWEMIKWAIESGCYLYDFLGVPVNLDENSPTYGVYRFKKGFNGRVVAYAGEFDYVLKPAVNTGLNAAQAVLRKAYQVQNHLRKK